MKKIDPKDTAHTLITFLKDTFAAQGFTKAAIAVSGGVDSATSCSLIVRALGAEHVYPLLLPYGDLNDQGTIDGRFLVNKLGIPVANTSVVDIKSFVDTITVWDPKMDHIRRGNIMARVRMILTYDAAKKHNALVIGTENKSEHMLGYFTRFGDEASDIEPLRSLYKTHVYELGRFLEVPSPILMKAPTAGLWVGQTDEGEFGFTYKEADEIIHALYDEKKTIEDVMTIGYDKGLVELVKSWVERYSFKHKLPILSPHLSNTS